MKPFTLEKWNASAEHGKALNDFLNTPTGDSLLRCLNTSQPSYNRVPNMQPTDALIELGRENGWRDCINMIQALRREPQTPSEDIQSTYAPENNE